jgi:hypothetical protein
VAGIVYRATVKGVSSVDITLELMPAVDGEPPIEPTDGFGHVRVNVPDASNAEPVGDILRTFGALIEVEGRVKMTIEPQCSNNKA